MALKCGSKWGHGTGGCKGKDKDSTEVKKYSSFQYNYTRKLLHVRTHMIDTTITGLKVVGEVKKVGKSKNFHPKVGKSRNFSVLKVGKVGILLMFLSLLCILVHLFCLFHF